MRKNIFYLVIFLYPFYATGQLPLNESKRAIDSLKRVLAKLPSEGVSFANDTIRVRALCEIAFYNALYKPDSSIISSESALKIAEKINHKASIARANHQLGYSYLLLNKDFEGTEYLFKSLELSEKLKLDTLIAVNNRQIGNAYFVLNKYKEAQMYYTKAMPYFLKIGYKKGYANCLNDIGRGYFLQKEYDEALKYFQRCLNYSSKNNLEIMKNYCSWSIANTFIERKEYDKALVYANRGIELNKTIDGVVDHDWIMGYEAFARIYYGKKDYKKALYYAKKAIDEFPKMGNTSKMHVYKRLYEIYKETGDYQKSLYYHEGYIQLLEGTKKQEYEKQLQSMQFEYDNLKLKDKNEVLTQERLRDKLIRNSLIIGLLGIFAFGVFFWWNNRLLKNKNQLIENQKREILLVKTEVEELNTTLESKVEERTLALKKANEELSKKNQEILEALEKGQTIGKTIERERVASELHDNLGSTLSGIKFMLQALDIENLTPKEQKIYTNILSLMNNAYNEVRLISHHLLPKNFEEMGLFGSLQKLIYDINQSEKLKIELVVDKNVLIKDKKIELELYSICLELINNILKHAKATKAELSFMQAKDSLNLIIKDNGKGGLDMGGRNNGKGINNIKNRLETLSALIDIVSTIDEGTAVKITVPLHK